MNNRRSVVPKKIFPVLLGEALESYDFLLYGLLSVYFSKIFFPQNSEYALIFSFSLFSVAYIARPFGTIIWGHVADKYGRKKAMIGTLSLMAIPAIGMAVMPSYEQIGITACVFVVALRFLQGIAFGGESPTVIVSLYELAPENKKGFYGSFYNPGALIGYLVGIILLIVLNVTLGASNFQNYGWRFLFGLSVIFIAVLSYLRFKLIETKPVVLKYNQKPILIALKQDCIAIIKIVLYLSCSTIMFYNLFFHNYLILSLSKFGVSSLFSQAMVTLVAIVIFPLMGVASDKVNKVVLLRISYIVIFISTPFLYLLFLTQDLFYMVFGYIIFAILTAVVCSSFPAVIVGQVSKNCRVTTIGICFSLSVISGSFIPLANETLKSLLNNNLAPAFIICTCALASLISLATLNKDKIL